MLCSAGMKLSLCTGRMLGVWGGGGHLAGCHGDLDFFTVPLRESAYGCKPGIPDSFDLDVAHHQDVIGKWRPCRPSPGGGGTRCLNTEELCRGRSSRPGGRVPELAADFLCCLSDGVVNQDFGCR